MNRTVFFFIVLCLFFILIKEKMEMVLTEEEWQPRTLSFSEEHAGGFTEHHVIAFIGDVYDLVGSFEPMKGERHILYGIHYSDLYPKKESADECPYYQEKIFAINGFPSQEANDRYFFSSREENTFHVANLSYFTFNSQAKKVKMRMVQSYHPSSEKELDYVEILPPGNIRAYKLASDKYKIYCVLGAYAYEASIRPELKGVHALSGFMTDGSKGYLLNGYSKDGEAWTITAYDYDRRFMQSLPSKTFTLIHNGTWKIRGI